MARILRPERIFAVLGTAVAAGSLLVSAVHADTVILDNGKELEGRVSDDGKTVTIEMAQGVVKISKSRVVAIEPKLTLSDEFAQRSQDLRRAAVAAKLSAAEQAELWFTLSQWAEEKKLPRYREEALKKTLEYASDHALARQGLGFVRYGGEWVTLSERNQRMGMVFHDGRWVAKEAREDALRAKEEREQKVRQDDTEQRRKEAETEKLEAERRLLDSQRAALEADRYRPRYVYTTAPYTIGGFNGGMYEKPCVIPQVPSAPVVVPGIQRIVLPPDLSKSILPQPGARPWSSTHGLTR